MKVKAGSLAMNSSTLDMECEHDRASGKATKTFLPASYSSIKIQTTLSKSTQRLIQKLSMTFITLQQSVNPLLVRYAHSQSDPIPFLASAVVLMTELIRIMISCALLCVQHGSVILFLRDLQSAFIYNKSETIRVSAPALIYVIQNNLYFFALKRINATLFSISYQLRILTTALLTKLLLGRILSNIQWGALLISLIGVVSVQLSSHEQTSFSLPLLLSRPIASNKTQIYTAKTIVSPTKEHLDYEDKIVGLVVVFVMCWTSAFAGVYLEAILKNDSCDILMQNIRLSVITLPFAVITLLNDYVIIQEHGLYCGWTSIVWLITFSNAISGIVVATVMKYADNIRKGYCQSIALGGTALLPIIAGDARFSLGLAIGVVMVVTSTFLYSFYPAEPATCMRLLTVTEYQRNSSQIFELNSESDSGNDDDENIFEKSSSIESS